MKKIVCLLLGCMSFLCYSAPKKVYVWQDEAGILVFSDSPRPGAEEVKLNVNPNIVSLVGPTTIDFLEEEETQESVNYSIEITHPAQHATVRNNNGTVKVSGKVSPSFSRGLQVKLFVDGKPYDKAKSSSNYTLLNMDRGEHQIYMQLLDKSGKVIATSSTTTFYLHRNSVLNNPN